MSLHVVDGMRTFDGANYKLDLNSQSVTAQANTTSVNMTNFSSLMVVGLCNAITGSGTGQIVVQESNESGANFTNVSGGVANFNAANTCRIVHVDWRDPARKQFARIAAFNATNAVTLSAVSMRIEPKRGGINTDTNVIKA